MTARALFLLLLVALAPLTGCSSAALPPTPSSHTWAPSPSPLQAGDPVAAPSLSWSSSAPAAEPMPAPIGPPGAGPPLPKEQPRAGQPSTFSPRPASPQDASTSPWKTTAQGALAGPAPSPSPLSARALRLTDLARYLAGLKGPSGGPLARDRSAAAWKKHAALLDQAWASLDKGRLRPIRSWAELELGALQASTTVFYPFSGPDFLYVHAFFPRARRYVLVGLESVGRLPALPEMDTLRRAHYLERTRAWLSSSLECSFFRTRDMEKDLKEEGVLPLLLVFLARSEGRLEEVTPVQIDPRGQVVARGQSLPAVPGVRIDYTSEGEQRSLFYFKADLSDEGMGLCPGLRRYLAGLGTPVTYLKAASYLLHYPHFSVTRKAILAHSKAVLQDDSGIPYHFFQEGGWRVQIYGHYTAPIGLFSERYQADLRQAYLSGQARPLGFGIGYHIVANDSNLLLARRPADR